MAAVSTSPYIDPDFQIKGSAEGPLKGLTFAVKDLFDVRLVPPLKGICHTAL